MKDTVRTDMVERPPVEAVRDGQPAIRRWLKVMNGALGALEETVWQGREIASQAMDAWKALERGTDAALEQYYAVAAEAQQWPARIGRLSKTGWMLTKLIGSYRLWQTRAAFIPENRLPAAVEKLHRNNARRFVATSLEQGGAFLKIGQLLSGRPDLLPAAWIEELAVLQDEVTPEPFEVVRDIIEDEFGSTLEDLFAEFGEEPIAAASIGQVHRARLHDGRIVAVKVQRPDLDELIGIDMKLLRLFMNSVRESLPPMDYDTITDEIERTVTEELNYRGEAEWMRRIGERLADKPGVTVPATVDGLCGERVLTSEFIEGRKLNVVLQELRGQGREGELADLLGRLLDMYMTQVLGAGYFQADPHPGNLLVSDGGELVLLDFGATMELPEHFRAGYHRILSAAILGETGVIMETLASLGFTTESGDPDTLLAFVDVLLDQIRAAALGAAGGAIDWPAEEEMLDIMADLLNRLESDPVNRVPAEFIMLARVFGTLGGLFLHYRPQFDINRYVLPHILGKALEPLH